uniref:Uncharacterized protein n=1 Tax=Octopus bimaculoides TaxID=37653 RepID=A0A0L8GF87_OCTBM
MRLAILLALQKKQSNKIQYLSTYTNVYGHTYCKWLYYTIFVKLCLEKRKTSHCIYYEYHHYYRNLTLLVFF